MSRDVIVVGASAGGVEALTRLAEGLPAELPASVLIVLHVMPAGTSVLPQILDRAGAMHASAGRDGEPFEQGHIYVAPPDRHMILRGGQIQLTHGRRDNGHRPAVDTLFRSAARECGSRVVAVVLSGLLSDGAAGLGTVKSHGGLAIVQDPEDALYPDMPLNAARTVEPDYVASVAEIPRILASLVEPSHV